MSDSDQTINESGHGYVSKNLPPIVSPEEWEGARVELLEQEKATMRAHDALAAKRRRMPRMAVEKTYEFEGPQGRTTLLDLFKAVAN